MGQTTSVRGATAGGSTQLRNVSLSVDQNRLTSFSDGVLGDYSSTVPDECLALIFQSLSAGDRRTCSLVCRRWLAVEGQSRHRLCVNASNDVVPHLPKLLHRFDSVTKLALRCDRKSVSLNDDGLNLISLRCPNLTSFKIRACRDISDQGMSSMAQNCKSLRKFSCGSCTFGAKGMNALLNHCSSLEELTVKRLRGINDGFAVEPILPGVASSSLKSIILKELYNGQCFGSLIIGSKNLTTLKILRCLGDWDGLLEEIAGMDNRLIEIHLERLQVSDAGLISISKCPNLENFHLVKAPDCSDDGISAIAENCKLLRKIYIDGWRTNRISDAGLVSIANNTTNLIELVLIGVNPSFAGLSAIASKCHRLERLALCGSETIGDTEVSCIAAKCFSLKKLCIKSCRVTNNGIEAFAFGCPNLVKMKIKKCREVTIGVVRWLRAARVMLEVVLDADTGLGGRIASGDVASVECGVGDGVSMTGNGGRSPNKLRRGILASTLVACACSSSGNGNTDANERT